MLALCFTRLFLSLLDPRISKVACENPDCRTAGRRSGAVKLMPLAHGCALGAWPQGAWTSWPPPPAPELSSGVVTPWVPAGAGDLHF